MGPKEDEARDYWWPCERTRGEHDPTVWTQWDGSLCVKALEKSTSHGRGFFPHRWGRPSYVINIPNRRHQLPASLTGSTHVSLRGDWTIRVDPSWATRARIRRVRSEYSVWMIRWAAAGWNSMPRRKGGPGGVVDRTLGIEIGRSRLFDANQSLHLIPVHQLSLRLYNMALVYFDRKQSDLGSCRRWRRVDASTCPREGNERHPNKFIILAIIAQETAALRNFLFLFFNVLATFISFLMFKNL